MMMKSEYVRSYQWNSAAGGFNGQHLKAKHNFSEPIMTHKRRVKLTEDNVIIGEPLPSQSEDYTKEDPYFVLGDKNKKFHPSVPYRNIRVFDQSKCADKSHKIQQKQHKHKNKHESRKQAKAAKFVNEEVQTDNGLPNRSKIASKRPDKATQVSPTTLGQLEIKEHDTRTDNQSKQMLTKNQFVGKGAQPPVSQTEYQTKYAWKEPTARQSSAFDKGAQNKSKFDVQLKIYNNFISEYQRQFRPYEFVGENRFRRMKSSTTHPLEDSNMQVIPERPQIQRRAVTPPPVWKHRNTRDTEVVATQPTPHSHRASLPRSKSKRFVTEYSENFDNKWNRLEAEIQKSLEEEQARHSSQQSRWFKEILDLRKKAHEYRQRARGTHFSREHLGEIFTKDRRRDPSDSDGHHSTGDADESPARPALTGVGSARHKVRHNPRMSTRRRSMSGSGRACYSSSSDSTIADRRRGPGSSARSSPTRKAEWQSRFAGKPSFDNSLLLDEEASHDTDVKEGWSERQEDNRRFSPGHKYPPRSPGNSRRASPQHTYPGKSPDEYRRGSPQHSYPGRSPDNSRQITQENANQGRSTDNWRHIPLENANPGRSPDNWRHTPQENANPGRSQDNWRHIPLENANPGRSPDVRTGAGPPQPPGGRLMLNGHQDMRHTVSGDMIRRPSPGPDTKYSLRRFIDSDKPGDARNMKTLPYEVINGADSSVSKVSSVHSLASSTSRSLALDTLERARRNRDQVLFSRT